MATRKRPTNPPDPVGPPAPTTTTPPASPTTTVPAQPATGTSTELAAAMALILQQYPWLANAEENRLRAIGQNSVKVLDEQGKLIRYEGLEKTLPSGEQVAPQYYQGDEYSISTWTTEDIRDYQNKLIAGGFFSGLKKPTVLGVVTPDTITPHTTVFSKRPTFRLSTLTKLWLGQRTIRITVVVLVFSVTGLHLQLSCSKFLTRLHSLFLAVPLTPSRWQNLPRHTKMLNLGPGQGQSKHHRLPLSAWNGLSNRTKMRLTPTSLRLTLKYLRNCWVVDYGQEAQKVY